MDIGKRGVILQECLPVPFGRCKQPVVWRCSAGLTAFDGEILRAEKKKGGCLDSPLPVDCGCG